MGITAQGRALIARTKNGEQLTFTKIKIGTGTLPGGETEASRTSLVNFLKDVPITSAYLKTPEQFNIKVLFSNEDLTEAKRITEQGIYAKIGNEAEVLYAYFYLVDGFIDLPVPTGDRYLKSVKEFGLKTSDTGNAQVIIDGLIVHPTIEDMNRELNKKADKITMESELAKKVDKRKYVDNLGQGYDLNNLKNEGNYYVSGALHPPHPNYHFGYVDVKKVDEDYIYQEMDVVGIGKFYRHFTNGNTWQDWKELINNTYITDVCEEGKIPKYTNKNTLKNTDIFIAKTFEIDNTNYKKIIGLTHRNLSSKVKVIWSGNSNGSVLNGVIELFSNHSSTIQYKAISGSYKQLKIKIAYDQYGTIFLYFKGIGLLENTTIHVFATELVCSEYQFPLDNLDDGFGTLPFFEISTVFGELCQHSIEIRKTSLSAFSIAKENAEVSFGVDTQNDILFGKAAEKKADKTYVDTKVAQLVNSSPEALDTLKELALALGNDPNFATTITNLIATKLSSSEVSALVESSKVVRRNSIGKIPGLENVENISSSKEAEADKIAQRTSEGFLKKTLKYEPALQASRLPKNKTILTKFQSSHPDFAPITAGSQQFIFQFSTDDEASNELASFGALMAVNYDIANPRMALRTFSPTEYSSWVEMASKNYVDGTHNRQQTGYHKMSNGIIIQWGYVNLVNGQINFPITFPVECFSVTCSSNNGSSYLGSIGAYSKTGFDAYGFWPGVGRGNIEQFKWIAIGY